MVKPVLNCILQILIVSFPLSSAIWNSFPPHFPDHLLLHPHSTPQAPACGQQGELIQGRLSLGAKASPNLLSHKKIFRFPSTWGRGYWNLVPSLRLVIVCWPAGSGARGVYTTLQTSPQSVDASEMGDAAAFRAHAWSRCGLDGGVGCRISISLCVNSVETYLPDGCVAPGVILSRLSCAVLSSEFKAKELGML